MSLGPNTSSVQNIESQINESSKIKIRGLTLSYGDAPPVLDGLDLDVRAGELVCVVGPSGCGKSSMLNVVAGFLRGSSGEVRVDGEPVTGPDRRRLFIFQESGLFPWLTVGENVGLGLLDRPQAARAKVVAEKLDLVGLAGTEALYPAELSGGMKQRVELARALSADPDVLYMDEPFGALDFLTRIKVRQDLVRIWERARKTILFVTHDVDESVQLADRVVVLSRRPTTIRKVIEVDLPRPRDMSSAGYLAVRDEIFETMGLDHSGVER